MDFFSRLFGGGALRRFEHIVSEIGAHEPRLQKLSDEELKTESAELRSRVQDGDKEILESILPQAFALVREVSRRTLGQRHFDVQLIGGIVLHTGKIAEMLTGEGKTLAATGPIYLNALTGKGVHVVTVNDYLARRDAIWMGQIYHFLGLSVSCIVHDAAFLYDPSFIPEEVSKSLDEERDTMGSFRVLEQFLRPITRKEAYQADVTYGTNHEFGFDYLRDNLAVRAEERVQRSYHYAIIDEVDSILIDEARTPLIIAAPDAQSSEYYKTFAKIVDHFTPEEDYLVDEKLRVVNITDAGIEKVEHALGLKNLFDSEHTRLVHFLQESLKAKTLFERDKHYIVRSGEVVIVDEFTGRTLQGRRYSGGLHQAIEAKEGVLIKDENRTHAQITIQNYFRLYGKIGGMTGTAQTSAEEFHKVYDLDVVSIPPNKPMVRKDASDAIYRTKDGKYKAVAAAVRERHEKGQPVLIGTTSISNNEVISSYLAQAGIRHEVLNAKNNEREGEIIAQAGRLGGVTVATNMAGRGVDIVLGGNPPDPEAARKVRDAGGLHVIGTERHEARRIDNQLRGRSGRQGDPGSTQFFLSLEDELLRIFGGDRIKRLMESIHFPENVPIESKMVTRAVNQSQQKVEGMNFDIRRHLLDFDDVLNKQRTALYRRRTELLNAGERGEILPILRETLEGYITTLEERVQALPREENKEQIGKTRELIEKLKTQFKEIPDTLDPKRAHFVGQHMTRLLDSLWMEHLESLESLRDSVNIRAYGQHEPIVEYRREARDLYRQLDLHFAELLWSTIFQVFSIDLESIQNRPTQRKTPPPPQAKNIGRNDPCWCGSGKKYKKCHGK